MDTRRLRPGSHRLTFREPRRRRSPIIRFLVKPLAWLLGGTLVLAIAVTLFIVLDARPLVPVEAGLSKMDRLLVSAWIAANRPDVKHDPGVIDLSLNEREASLLLNALLDRVAQGGARISLDDGQAHLRASLRLPFDQVRGYLNIELRLDQGSPIPRIASARIGGVPIPSRLIQSLADRTLDALARAQVLEALEIHKDRLDIRYQWRPDMLEHIASELIAAQDLPRVLHYQTRLQELVRDRPKRKPVPLADLLTALLTEADADETADPVAANRAIIIALAAYTNGRTILDPTRPDARPATRPRAVLLRGRADLGQHFMTSAALVLQGNDVLSGLVGWYKELADSDGGSGFSFADMTANRAGIRFARLAVESRASARRVQRMGSIGLSEEDFMPLIDRLPEGMARTDFAGRFADPETHAYQRMIQRIDQRIDARRLFQSPSG